MDIRLKSWCAVALIGLLLSCGGDDPPNNANNLNNANNTNNSNNANNVNNSNNANNTNNANNVALFAPTGLTISVEPQAITLTWDAAENAERYHVFWDTQTVDVSTASRSVTENTTFRHDGLQAGTTYYYRVTTVDLAGESEPSEEVSGTPQQQLPRTPGTLIGVAGDTEATISWDAVPGSESYTLYYAPDPDNVENGTTIENVSSPYTITGLTNGTLYRFGVRALNETGESPLSSLVGVTPRPDVPSAPLNVSAVAGSDDVSVSWDQIAGLRYNVYWSTSPNVDLQSSVRVGDVSSPFDHLGLNHNQPYFYVVTAFNPTGESPPSAEVSATPSVGVPTAPQNVVATPGSGNVTVTWDPVADADGYDLFWATIPGASGPMGTRVNDVTAPFDHQNLTNGTTYYYIVVAKNVGGTSPDSVEVSATPQPTAPEAPTNVMASGGDTTVTIAWDPDPTATRYDIYWSTNPAVSSATGAQIPNVPNPYNHLGRVNGTTYYYVIVASNVSGQSPDSGVVSATPLPGLLGPPTGLTATQGDAQITLTWNPVIGATRYDLYWSLTPGVTPQNGNRLSDISSGHVHLPLNNGSVYHYVVTASNLGGESAPSPEVNATPEPFPDAPANLVAIAGTGQATLTWNPAANANTYNLYFGTSPGVTPLNGTLIANVTSPYVHTGLTDDQTYYWIVTGENGTGEGAPSVEASATPRPVPDVPSNVAVARGDTELVVSWDPAVAADSYNIYWSTTPGVTLMDTKITGATSPYTHTGLTNGTTYYYRIESENTVATSGLSIEVSEMPQVPPPTTPVNFTASPANQSITLSWFGVAEATSYDIYWSTTPGVTSGTGTRLSNVTSPYVHTGLTNGVTYYYVITASNAGGSSPDSAEISETPAASPWQQVSLTSLAGFAIKQNGTLWGWGRNNAGQLGDGTFTDQLSPTQIGADADWTMIAVSGHKLGLKSDGTLWSWGFNSSGQLGLGTVGGIQTTPIQIGSDTDWDFVAVGSTSSYAIKTNGLLYAWGENGNGQLGIGSSIDQSTPQQVGVETWSMVGAGACHAGGLKTDQTLMGWGCNGNGQVGDGTTTIRVSPVVVDANPVWRHLSVGSYHSHALRTDDTLWGWGRNTSGNIGDGTTAGRTSPVQIGADTDWLNVDAGTDFSIAAKTNGVAYSWGESSDFQLGDPTVTGDVLTPSAIAGPTGITEVSAGARIGMVLNPATGELWSFGNNQSGATAAGFDIFHLNIEQVGGDSDWAWAGAGYDNSWAIKTDGTLWGFGANTQGQLGFNDFTPRDAPQQIGVATDWASITGGGGSAAAIKTDNTLWTWGTDTYDQLGNGATGAVFTPTQVGIDTDWVDVECGLSHCIGRKSGQTIYTWGRGNYGQLGDGNSGSSHTLDVPTQVGSDTDWIEISAGENYCVAIKSGGTLWAWGRNDSGQIGNSTTFDQTTPQQIGVATDWIEVSTGEKHTLARKTDGTIWSWGESLYGRLGYFGGDQLFPLQIGMDADWASLRAGNVFSFATKTDGTLWGWGANFDGQMGNGTQTHQYTPFMLTPDTDTNVVAAGRRQTVVIKGTGLWAWGGNYDGQTGHGTTWQETPLLVPF